MSINDSDLAHSAETRTGLFQINPALLATYIYRDECKNRDPAVAQPAAEVPAGNRFPCGRISSPLAGNPAPRTETVRPRYRIGRPLADIARPLARSDMPWTGIAVGDGRIAFPRTRTRVPFTRSAVPSGGIVQPRRGNVDPRRGNPLPSRRSAHPRDGSGTQHARNPHRESGIHIPSFRR
jgi:hypothetical protein